MARKQRIWPPGAKLHITSRGNRKSSLFLEEDDFQKYLSLLAEIQTVHPFILHAYCLMSNHTHLQLQTVETPLGIIMRELNLKYAKYFNRKYELSGHLFQDRYNASLIDSPSYELDVSRYIHRNPLKAGLVEAPEDYLWSSCPAYVLGEESPIIQTAQILSYFPNPFFKNYEAYLKAPIPDLDETNREMRDLHVGKSH